MDPKEEKAIGGDHAFRWAYNSKGSTMSSLLGKKMTGALYRVSAGAGVFSNRTSNGAGAIRDRRVKATLWLAKTVMFD